MKWSQANIFTLKEAPADAEIPSHKLLVRAGFIKKTAPGIHTLQHLAVRALRKIENIIRSELDSRNCTEIIMPIVHPRELWDETNRWSEMGDGLLKFKNRNGHEFCLAATHEECVTDIARRDIKSYRDLPRNLYQIQTKYRDEIRPRFGLMRGREFLMKDAYSFDQDRESSLVSYKSMYEAYEAIFTRTGLNYRVVEADAGNIGGSQTHEFQVLAGAGEDHLMACDTCRFAANVEVAPAIDGEEKRARNGGMKNQAMLAMEEFATPGLRTIDDLSAATKAPAYNLVKTLFVNGSNKKPVGFLLRGNDELNLIKVKNLLGLANEPIFLTEEQVKAATTASPGSCGPVGLKIPIYADNGLKDFTNFVVGANKDDFHLKNVNFDRDFKLSSKRNFPSALSETGFVDIRVAEAGDKCPSCDPGHYQSLRGIEVGHVFYLGTKYSKLMQANFLNAQGKSVPIEMGCYGIGVTRVLQAAVEQNHDADGIIWPIQIAPFDVHICILDPKSNVLQSECAKLTEAFDQLKISYLVDDRDERPGSKFKDADLIGLPLRLVLGEKSFAQGNFELVIRKTKEKLNLAPSEIPAFAQKWIMDEFKKSTPAQTPN